MISAGKFRQRLECLTKKKTFFFLFFFSGYLLIFSRGIRGIGGYWDWSFPYFSDQIKNIYLMQSSSWLERDGGTPLSYSPDLYFRYVFSQLHATGVPPEVLLYFFLVLTFTIGTYLVWRILSMKCGHYMAAVLSMLVFINPLMLYKATAGHFNYYPALVLFIALLAILLSSNLRSFRRVLAVAVLVALSGIQIQFFIFSLITIVLWLVFNFRKVRKIYILPAILVVIAFHMPWLVNFILGANDAAATSSRAGLISNQGSGISSFTDQIRMTFSPATHLHVLLPFLYWPLAVLFWVVGVAIVASQKVHNSHKIFILSALVVFMSLATGFYLRVDLGPFSFFSPMLREVGHFGPIVMLFLILTVGYSIGNLRQRLKKTAFCFFSVFLMITAAIFFNNVPTVNYASARAGFLPFKNYLENNTVNGRVMSYPFFGQYQFLNQKSVERDGVILNNTGYDNFLKYTSVRYVNNAVQAVDFKDSIQYRLSTTYDLDILEPYSIEYLFDFSSIYESNYNRYVPKNIYDNNLGLIKNDKKFFEKLILKNPGKIEQVEPGIYRILNYKPLVSVNNNLALTSSRDASGSSRDFVASTFGRSTDYINTSDQVSGIRVFEPLFKDNDGEEVLSDAAEKSSRNSIKIDEATKGTIYTKKAKRDLYYTYLDGNLRIYAASPVAENYPALDFVADKTRAELITTLRLGNFKEYYISWLGELVMITKTEEFRRIGQMAPSQQLKVYSLDEAELVKNGDFSNGAWQQSVSNCNNYDNKPLVSMALLNERGNNFLKLAAARHTACTSTGLEIKNETDYLLKFDYRSSTSMVAEFYLQYGDDPKQGFGRRAPVVGSDWQQFITIVRSNYEGKASLFNYARPVAENTENSVEYDNYSFRKLNLLSVIDTSAEPYGYDKADLNFIKEATSLEIDDHAGILNILPSDNFNRGLWQGKVQDCGNYDNNPEIDMALKTGAGYAGANALQLSAVRHTACTTVDFSITESAEYRLSFDFLTNFKNSAGYAVVYNDPAQTIESYRLGIYDKRWASYAKSFKTPEGATKGTIYFYAFENLLKKRTEVLYSSIKLTKQSSNVGKFFYMNDAPVNANVTRLTPELEYARKGPAQYDMTLRQASGRVLIILSENYNPLWKLRTTADDNSIDAGEGVKHVMANDYSNGWLIDLDQLCSQIICDRDIGGNVTIDLQAYFSPQKWYQLSHFFSSIIIVISVIVAVTPVISNNGRLLYGILLSKK